MRGVPRAKVQREWYWRQVEAVGGAEGLRGLAEGDGISGGAAAHGNGPDEEEEASQDDDADVADGAVQEHDGAGGAFDQGAGKERGDAELGDAEAAQREEGEEGVGQGGEDSQRESNGEPEGLSDEEQACNLGQPTEGAEEQEDGEVAEAPQGPLVKLEIGLAEGSWQALEETGANEHHDRQCGHQENGKDGGQGDEVPGGVYAGGEEEDGGHHEHGEENENVSDALSEDGAEDLGQGAGGLTAVGEGAVGITEAHEGDRVDEPANEDKTGKVLNAARVFLVLIGVAKEETPSGAAKGEGGVVEEECEDK